ncbi:MAG: septal ring lytic transglycosylase RlpA family protein [Bacteroidetes bacterium]|nr:MAG: septal ring lytic transglycosylase RlpA family protein [Bacteroidota bacterium]TAG88149.1 MAG: septal ring lytic transglycosylase RlpA family protein [Bacteroidota bacterium]
MKYLCLFICVLSFFVSGCDVTIPTITDNENNTNSLAPKGTKLTGKASYYADKFNGKPTASGQKFDNKLFTAAHKTLPFGTRLNVKNLKNNKIVVVTVNDRLPKTSTREIDLSQAAAKALDMIRDGVVQVEINVL